MSVPPLPSTHPRWFTPARLLCIFCYTNLCVYLDRGRVVSAMQPGKGAVCTMRMQSLRAHLDLRLCAPILIIAHCPGAGMLRTYF